MWGLGRIVGGEGGHQKNMQLCSQEMVNIRGKIRQRQLQHQVEYDVCERHNEEGTLSSG